MDISDFGTDTPSVFLDRRDANQFSDPFTVLVWDQRSGMVHLFVESGWAFGTTASGEPDWSRSSRRVEVTHESRLLVHAANVPYGDPIPTVPQQLELLSLVIVRPDGEVFYRNQEAKS